MKLVPLALVFLGMLLGCIFYGVIEDNMIVHLREQVKRLQSKLDLFESYHGDYKKSIGDSLYPTPCDPVIGIILVNSLPSPDYKFVQELMRRGYAFGLKNEFKAVLEQTCNNCKFNRTGHETTFFSHDECYVGKAMVTYHRFEYADPPFNTVVCSARTVPLNSCPAATEVWSQNYLAYLENLEDDPETTKSKYMASVTREYFFNKKSQAEYCAHQHKFRYLTFCNVEERT